MAKQKSTDHSELLATARKRFKNALEAEEENRRTAIDDVRFENGDQWDLGALKLREGRPSLVINKTAGVLKKIVGEARQNRPRIKVRPVDDQADPAVAELLNGLIRNIENLSKAEGAYDNGFECAARGGYGYWRIVTEYAHDATFEQDICIKRIVNPFSVYFDQSAMEADFSDAQYAFVCETLSAEEFKEQYPDADSTEWDKGDGEDFTEWFTSETRRIAEYFYKKPVTKDIFELVDGRTIEVKKPTIVEAEGQQGPVQLVYSEDMPQPLPFTRTRKVKSHKIMWCKMTGNSILEGPQEWAGSYIPIVPCLGEEVWIEGKRILRSAIKWAKDPARLYNWARSTAAETIAMAPKQPFLLTPEEIEGHEEQWEQAHVKPMPYLLHNQTALGRPTRQQGSFPDTGALQEAMQAADDIKATTGLFDASLGAQGNETSGKAINARQRQGETATFVFTDNQAAAVQYTGKILVDLIPKIYDTQRVVRLLNEDGSESWGKINILDPTTGEVVANDLSLGRYDVVVDSGPAYMTKRIEAADGLVQLSQAAPQFAPIFIPRIAKNMDWPEAQEIGEEIRAMTQPQQQQPDPKMEMELQKGQIDLQKGQMDLQKEQMDIEGKQLDNRKKEMEMMQEGMGVADLNQRIAQIEQLLARILGVQ